MKTYDFALDIILADGRGATLEESLDRALDGRVQIGTMRLRRRWAYGLFGGIGLAILMALLWS